MTTVQVEDFYLRWREVMLVAATHGAVMVAAYEHKGFFKDLLERLEEDPWWRLQVPVGDKAVVLADQRVPRDEMLFSVGGRLVSIQEVVKSRRGFGRFGSIAAPTRDGVRPWDTAPVPKDFTPPAPDVDEPKEAE